MDINLSLSGAPGISNPLIVAVYNTSAPNVAVQYQVLAAPHAAPVNVVFNNLDEAAYNVITWENTSNVPGGTIRHRFVYEAGWQSAQIRVDLSLTVGAGTGNPAAGTTTFTRPDLSGWVYSIERRGFGTMIQGEDISIDITATIWTLLNSGDQFNGGEKWIVHFQPKIVTTQAPQNQSAGIWFSDYVSITADTVLDNTYLGKCLLLQGAGVTLGVTLPDFTTFPDNKAIGFVSDGGTHINATIQTSLNSQFIQFNNKQRLKVYLGQGESMIMIKYGGLMRVLMTSEGNWNTVGEIVFDYAKQDFSQPNTKGQLNTVFADGSLLDRATYPRLWEYVSNLDPTEVIDDSNWGDPGGNNNNSDPLLNTYPNKGKYSRGDGNTQFRVPLLYAKVDPTTQKATGAGFMRGVDGIVRKAGSFELANVGQHVHYEQSGAIPDGANGTSKNIVSLSYGTYGGKTSGQHVDLTDKGHFILDNGTEGDPLGPDNKPMNTGIYLSIKI